MLGRDLAQTPRGSLNLNAAADELVLEVGPWASEEHWSREVGRGILRVEWQ